jgi:hypothetical protein
LRGGRGVQLRGSPLPQGIKIFLLQRERNDVTGFAGAGLVDGDYFVHDFDTTLLIVEQDLAIDRHRDILPAPTP